jgi:thiamine monophosphate synthase
LVRLAGSKPCIAIGSVTPADVAAVVASGGSGVAASSGILAAENVEAAARAYWRSVKREQ